MIASHQDQSASAAPTPRKAQWLPVLENEIRRRVGWVDEAVSPFARSRHAQDIETDVRHAA